MAAVYMRDPATGFVVKATSNWTPVIQLFLSPFHLGYHGIWGHAAVSLLLAIATISISNIVYAFIGGGIIRNFYLKKGWKVVPPDMVDKVKADFTTKSTLSRDEFSNSGRSMACFECFS